LAGALRALHAEKPKDVTLWQHLREIKDPIMAGVVYEDIAATLGAVIAAASIGMTTYTGNPVCSVFCAPSAPSSSADQKLLLCT
jgi:zinc transporter 9